MVSRDARRPPSWIAVTDIGAIVTHIYRALYIPTRPLQHLWVSRSVWQNFTVVIDATIRYVENENEVPFFVEDESGQPSKYYIDDNLKNIG